MVSQRACLQRRAYGSGVFSIAPLWRPFPTQQISESPSSSSAACQILLWGDCSDDLNGDLIVGTTDLLILLGNWG